MALHNHPLVLHLGDSFVYHFRPLNSPLVPLRCGCFRIIHTIQSRNPASVSNIIQGHGSPAKEVRWTRSYVFILSCMATDLFWFWLTGQVVSLRYALLFELLAWCVMPLYIGSRRILFLWLCFYDLHNQLSHISPSSRYLCTKMADRKPVTSQTRLLQAIYWLNHVDEQVNCFMA